MNSKVAPFDDARLLNELHNVWQPEFVSQVATIRHGVCRTNCADSVGTIALYEFGQTAEYITKHLPPALLHRKIEEAKRRSEVRAIAEGMEREDGE